MTAPGLRLEAATAASTEVLAALHQQTFTSEEQIWNAGSFRDLVAMPGARAWLAIEATDAGDLPVAFALVRFVADEGEIITIGVLPDRRRQGIARLLLAEIIREADSVKAALFLEVEENNVAALALYGESGFSEVGRRKNYYVRGNGEKADAIVLRRNAA